MCKLQIPLISVFAVLFTVAGAFLSPNKPINVSMVENEPYRLRCPPRAYSYSVEYDWKANAFQGVSIANNPSYAPRILMEPNGDLLFSYVKASDFDTFISKGQAWTPIICGTRTRYFDSASGPPVYFYVTSPGERFMKRYIFKLVPRDFFRVNSNRGSGRGKTFHISKSKTLPFIEKI